MQLMKKSVTRDQFGENQSHGTEESHQTGDRLSSDDKTYHARKFIRLATACREYDTPRSNWYRAFERGELTRYKRGTTVYLDTTEIESWITGNPIRSE